MEFFQAVNWITNKSYAEKQIALSHKAKIRVMPQRVKVHMSLHQPALQYACQGICGSRHPESYVQQADSTGVSMRARLHIVTIDTAWFSSVLSWNIASAYSPVARLSHASRATVCDRSDWCMHGQH